MRNPAEAIKPEIIIEIILRQRWYIIIPFCLSMMIGIYYALTLPKVYSATTLILLQPQRVPTNYVQSIVSVDLDSRINTLSQQILSRTNLEKIINEFKLYSGPNSGNMFMEDKIGSMRKRIIVDVTRNRRNTNAFSISFKGKDPEKTMRVTNALANYFIDENLKNREAQAIGTSDFLDDELSTMRKRLEEVEQALKNYREAYMGGLPEQLESNL
ncbi:MAG: protein GumC, partial [Deltaproteobacteria bacterium]|nr:protein GumC [Deltaproteobacteria bacterium]